MRIETVLRKSMNKNLFSCCIGCRKFFVGIFCSNRVAEAAYRNSVFCLYGMLKRVGRNIMPIAFLCLVTFFCKCRNAVKSHAAV